MMTPNAIAATVEYILLHATRGSLEERTSWYFRGIGKPGKERTTIRSTLENVFFVSDLLDLMPDGIYQLSLDGEVYKQQYLSGAEVIKYIITNCKIIIDQYWKEFRTKKGQLISVRYVAFDKEVRLG